MNPGCSVNSNVEAFLPHCQGNQDRRGSDQQEVYRFREFETSQIALFRQLRKLFEPETAHQFYEPGKELAESITRNQESHRDSYLSGQNNLPENLKSR